MNKQTLIHTLAGTVFCVLALAIAAVAQPGSGGPGPGGNPATQVPLDGGVSLLLAAGGAYGLKQLRTWRSKNKARGAKA